MKKKISKTSTTKTPKQKKPRGRPSKFPTLNIDQVRKLYLMGHTDFEVCQFFGICQMTLYRYCDSHPDFSESLKGWKEAADKRVERSLYQRATGYTHETEEIFQYRGKIIRAKTIKHYPPSDLAIAYWLNNRKRSEWAQKPDPQTDEELINSELEFKGIPNNGEGKHRFEKYLRR